jgi:hypothetical protein
MTKHIFLALIPIWAALSWSTAAQAPKPLDIAPFGTLSSWGDGEQPRAASIANPGHDLGIEWRDERDVREIRVRFAGPDTRELKVQYWFSTWPSTPPEMPNIEDPVDDRWQGEWLTAAVDRACRAGECRFTFQPLAKSENRLAGNMPGLRYRRTLKVRLLSDTTLPAVRSIAVFSDSVEQPLSLRIALGYQEPQPVRWEGGVEVSNGQLRSARPWNFKTGDAFQSAAKWSLQSAAAMKGLLVDVTAAAPSLPGSLDSTLVTIRAKAGAADRTFTFNVDDLKRGPIYAPDFHAYVSAASQPAGFHPPPGKGPRIRTQIPAEPEQSYQRASREIPALDPWQTQSGRPMYLLLAPDSSWQKFAFEYGGNVFIRKGDKAEAWSSGTKAKGKELARLDWAGDRITWRIGTGAVPYYREDRRASVSLQDGYLPVVTQQWENDGLRYSEEAFTTLLRGPLSPDGPGRDEQTPAILLLRLTAENSASSARTAHVWLSVQTEEQQNGQGAKAEEKLRVTGKQVWTQGAVPRLRATFDTAGPLPSGAGAAPVHFTFEVPAGSRGAVTLKLPFVPDLSRAEAAELERMDYAAQRDRVAAYWLEHVGAGARFSTPEPRFDLLMKALLWHIRMGVTKDPVSGLYMVPAAGYDYQVFANEACFQALLLDTLGQHETAAAYLEAFLRLQGSKGFPGLHRGMEDAIFHGVRVNQQYDYTASTYGLDHPTVLWTLGEHYLYSRNKEWLLHAWPHMEKAIAWIQKQREATRQPGAREYGLLPASSLEDNSDWANWFSINSYAWAGLDRAARALADIGHPEAARIRAAADSYRSELRNAVLRASQAAPLTQLRDGTYVPYVPVEPNQRFRRFGPSRVEYYKRYGKPGIPMLRLAATREALYGPIILLNMGVFGTDEPIANWILDDWEDNVTLTSGLGVNVHGITDDRLWFSQGGMVFQANLQNPILVYLKRHEIPAAVRSIYNNFVACLYPDANALTEEFHEWSHASGPFYKTPDEARFVNRIRDALALEDGDALYLASGVPRRWLESPAGIRVDAIATYFGPVSYSMKPGAEPGTIEAAVQLPVRNPAGKVWLVARMPQGRIHSVTINGEPWTKIDNSREAIELPQGSSSLQIRIR